MIYLVTQQILPSTDAYKIVSVEESISLLKPLNIIGLDTETSGFNVFLKDLLLVQMGNKDFQVVIDTTTINITLYKDILEDNDKGFILWNADFDLRFFYRKGIIIKQIYDGYLAERVLWLGYPAGEHSMSLKSAAENYLGVHLDKTIRGKIIWSKTLTDDIIVYAARDVEFLEHIMNKQLIELRAQNLIEAVMIESQYVRVNAYMEFCGVKLDIGKWQEKMKQDKIAEQNALNELNRWVTTNYRNDKRFCHIELQGDLFEGFDDEPHCIINWKSPKQVIPFFETLGFKLDVIDKKTGLSKKSIDAKVIKSQSAKSSISSVYIAYKEAEKLTSTYGQNFIDLINPITGRIHTNFNSLGTDTARVSSGGGEDLETIPGKKIPLVNMQNLPSDPLTRSCFIAEKGNKWISADYKGQESFLMASIANDKEMLKELNEGSGDMHSLVAKKVFSEIPEDMPTKSIKKNFHELRQKAKGYEFLWNYGGDWNTLMTNFGLDEKKAKALDASYKKGFPGLAAYQNFRRKDVMEKGYILMSPISGYRAHIYDWEKLSRLKREFNEDFWNRYKQIPRNSNNIKQPRNDIEKQMVMDVKYYFKRKSASEKQSINYPIQHAGAMCYKLAAIYMFNWVVKEGLFNIVKFLVGAHDELNIEASENIAEKCSKKLVECMEKSGKIYCTKAKLTADVEINDYWVH